MAECAHCDKHTSMPFTCKFCEQSFCSTHRLPENHDCTGLEAYKEQSQEDGKIGYDVTPNTAQQQPTQPRTTALTDRMPQTGAVTDLLPVNITYIVLAVMFAVYMLEVTVSGFSQQFALYPELVFTEPWRIVTSMFLHAGFAHLLVNSIVLFQFGAEAERMLGTRKYLELLFAAGIASSIGFAASGLLFDLGAAVGISGALFGIVTFLAIVRPDIRVLAFFFIPLNIRTAIGFFAVIDVLNFAMQLLGQPGVYNLLLGIEVASAGHLSGLLIGLLYGFRLKSQYGSGRTQNMLRVHAPFGPR